MGVGESTDLLSLRLGGSVIDGTAVTWNNNSDNGHNDGNNGEGETSPHVLHKLIMKIVLSAG